ncbi:hypothetical protein D1159_02195 [Pseudoflavonifractor sp. 524-17]|nr:hypothetical protein [Pseudoflavonifractor sp. 524-17]
MNERLEQLKQSGGTQKLTEEQKNALSEKYDPQNMTLEEYRSLLDDLCEYGILEEGDKVFVGGENLVPLALSGPMVQVSSYSGPVHPGLGRQGGNVIEWANYEASFRTMNVDTQKYEKTLRAVLFGRIGSVLEQL